MFVTFVRSAARKVLGVTVYIDLGMYFARSGIVFRNSSCRQKWCERCIFLFSIFSRKHNLMNTTKTRFVHSAAAAAIVSATATTLLLCAAAVSHAQTTFFSTGFEASEGYSPTVSGPITVTQGSFSTSFTPTPGALIQQPSSNPRQYSFFNFGPGTLTQAQAIQQAVNSTTVVNTSAASGTQSVQINGNVLGDQSVEYVVARNLLGGANSTLRFSTDLRVTNPSASYGQWGLEFLRDDGQNLYDVGAIGFVGGQVLATPDGSNLYAAFDPNTGTAYRANYGEYNNYALQLNFSQRTISGYFNNTKVAFLPIDLMGNILGAPVSDMNFRSVADNLVSYMTFGESLYNVGENANYDNVRLVGTNVTASAAPEPASLALVGVGFVGIIGTLARRTAVKTKGVARKA